MSVDFPEPEGPHTTTTSPFSTFDEHSVRTWNFPYHLLTFWISIMAMRFLRVPSSDDRDFLLELLYQRGQREAEDEVDHRREDVHLHRPVVVLPRDLRRLQQVLRADRVDQRGVLEQDDGLGEQDRQHVPERLREDHQPHRLPVRHPDRLPRHHLPPGYALDPRPHDLAVVGRLACGEAA